MVERVREDGVDGVVEGVLGEWWRVCVRGMEDVRGGWEWSGR